MRLHLFDLDGTLTDSRAGLYASFRVALAAIGCPVLSDADLAPFLGTPLPMIFQTVRPEVTPAEIDRGIQAFRTYYEKKGIYRNRLYGGVREMLRAVRATGRKAWIVTSKPEVHAIRVVGLLGLKNLIHGVVGAGTEEKDTKAELIAHALSAARVPASEAMMLGDRHYDMIGAWENQVKAVGALWGYGSRSELADAHCHEFANTPDEFRTRYLPASAPDPLWAEPPAAFAEPWKRHGVVP